jgi:hypothetical protein
MSHIYKKNCFLYHDEGLRKVQCITIWTTHNQYNREEIRRKSRYQGVT